MHVLGTRTGGSVSVPSTEAGLAWMGHVSFSGCPCMVNSDAIARIVATGWVVCSLRLHASLAAIRTRCRRRVRR
jgi:hypothetical protein